MTPNTDPDDLLARVRQTCRRLFSSGGSVVVGVSGGPDSLALLHLLWRARESMGLALHVATLDHGLRGAAGAADAEFVRQIAAEWGLPCAVGRAETRAIARARRLNIEEAARQVRYAFLLRAARQIGAGWIAVGHTQDDQAETVLMRLIRGSGLSGLGGMRPAVSLRDLGLPDDLPISCDPPLADSLPESWPTLVRPLLDISRAEIEAYCAAHGLEPRRDATNEDPTYLRNHLRRDVLPLLEAINPHVRAALARAAALLREDAALIERLGEAALDRVIRVARPDGVILDRAAWDALSVTEQRYVLRAAIRRARPDLRDVTFEHIDHALACLGEPHAAVTLPGGLLLRAEYGALILGPAEHPPLELAPGKDAPALDAGQESRPFQPNDHLMLQFAGWQFIAEPLAPGHDLAAIHADPWAVALVAPPGTDLRLRTRRSGDRFCPRGMAGHSQKLSDTFTNMKVPRAWRDRVPLLTVGGEIAWFVAPTAGGARGRVGESFAIRESGQASGAVIVVARWQRRHL